MARTSRKSVERFGAVLCGMALLCAPAPLAAQPRDARSVLLLYGFDPFAPAVVAFDSALRAALGRMGPADLTLHNEVLDVEALADPLQAAKQRLWFQSRYGLYQPVAIVAVGPAGLAFALEERAALWPTVPIVFSGVDEETVAHLQLPSGVTGIARRPAVDETLRFALELFPDTRRVAFIGGTTDVDRFFELTTRPQMEKVVGHLEQIDLTGLPLLQMEERLAALPDHTIVFGVSLFRDGTGRSVRTPEAIQMLARWSRAPLFTTHAQMMGLGPVGGWVTDYGEMGGETGEMLAAVLNAPPGGALPAVRVAPVWPVADAAALARWNIPERSLPTGTVVLFGDVSVWRRYGWLIAGVLGALLLESALIAVLLLERKRRQAAEAEARSSQERIAHINRVSTVTELSGSLAHELNGPLGSIVNNARAARRFLNRDTPELKEVGASLQDIEASAERASQVISRLRSVLRKDEFRRSPLHLEAVVQDAVQLVSSEASRRRVKLDVQLAPSLPPVSGDSVLLLQVLLNLLLNALDAVSERPLGKRSIAIRGAARAEEVELSVSDSGPGLPTGALTGAFQPFFTTKANGLGMGLSICRSIAEAHSGRIAAENVPAGGAVFRLTLPTSPAPQEEAA